MTLQNSPLLVVNAFLYNKPTLSVTEKSENSAKAPKWSANTLCMFSHQLNGRERAKILQSSTVHTQNDGRESKSGFKKLFFCIVTLWN